MASDNMGSSGLQHSQYQELLTFFPDIFGTMSLQYLNWIPKPNSY